MAYKNILKRKACTVCGEEFLAKSNKAKFCKVACQVSDWRKRQKEAKDE